jgi:hypothetical protein
MSLRRRTPATSKSPEPNSSIVPGSGVTVLKASPALSVPNSVPIIPESGVSTSIINVTCPPAPRDPDKITMFGSWVSVVSVILDRVPVNKLPLFSAKLRVPELVKSPGLPETPVNAKGLPDKVKEVAPAKAPVPLKATPVSGPATVMVRLALLPEKVIVPVVGADKVTPESDALTVMALSVIANAMTAEIKIAFRIFEIILDPPGEASTPLPALLDAGDVSSHTTVVNSTRVLKPYFCSFDQPRPPKVSPDEIENGHQFAPARTC